MMKRRRAGWLAIALGSSVVGASAGQSPAGTAPIAAVVNGTAHQALFALAFDGGDGIAVGAGGQMLASQDGGGSWQAVMPALTEQSLLGVAVVSGRAIAVGQAGLIFVRDASGVWRPSTSGTEERLFAVSLNTDGVAVAVGAFGKVLKSVDGGLQWASVAPAWAEGYTEQGLEPHLYDVKVAPDGVITLVGEFGLILRSSDTGQGWTVLHKGEASLFALDLRLDGVGYAVGQGGVILRTTDGGATWAEVESGSAANLLGVRSSPDGYVVVTAMRDMLASDDGLSWRRIEWGDFGSAWYSGVNVVGADAAENALVVGHSGRIVRIAR